MALRTKQAGGIFILAIGLLSCNLPFMAAEVLPTPTEIIPPSPEATNTSIFPPTFSPPIAVATSTPTETSTPTFTNTPENTATSTKTLVPYNPNASPTPPPTIPSGYNSATPAPTRTKTSTKTPIGPAPTARPSFSVSASLFTPTIDGDWSEWPNAEIPAGYVVFGGGNWVNANDLNSSFKTAYDEKNLYIAAKVIDDIYVQNATGNKIYLGDSLEILLDKNLAGDYYDKGLSSDDYQLGISPGKGSITGAKEAYLWYPSNLRGAGKGVVIATQSISGGYRIEAAIPWSIFGITPASGNHYGFVFSVSDNDNPTQNLQESMVSNVSGRRFLNPTTWGDLVLQ